MKMFKSSGAHIFARKIPLFLLMTFLLGGCAGQQYISKRQKAGESLLWEKKFDEAIGAFKKAIHDAEKEGDKREVGHLKSLLGWTYAEAMRLEEAEREIKEAVKIAEVSGFDPALFYARLAVVNAKTMNYQEGIEAAEKALTLMARIWQSKAKTPDRDKIIDYAVTHHGLLPDVDMIRTKEFSAPFFWGPFYLTGDWR
ncbi:MAG: tetratricopeptide repeat protein [Deltaproteobacteria bacterium]|nr:tetratricopeptide repeat protein [Deltaproteobacteria bacterium]